MFEGFSVIIKDSLVLIVCCSTSMDNLNVVLITNAYHFYKAKTIRTGAYHFKILRFPTRNARPPEYQILKAKTIGTGAYHFFPISYKSKTIRTWAYHFFPIAGAASQSVSYTHLTLPTIYSV